MSHEYTEDCDNGDCETCSVGDPVIIKPETEAALAARRPDDSTFGGPEDDVNVLTAVSLEAFNREPVKATALRFAIGSHVKYSDAFLQSVGNTVRSAVDTALQGDQLAGFTDSIMSKMRGTVSGIILTTDHEPHVSVDWDGDEGLKSVICTTWLELADD